MESWTDTVVPTSYDSIQKTSTRGLRVTLFTYSGSTKRFQAVFLSMFYRYADATTLELFFDLTFVANPATFSATHEIYNLLSESELLNYFHAVADFLL